MGLDLKGLEKGAFRRSGAGSPERWRPKPRKSGRAQRVGRHDSPRAQTCTCEGPGASQTLPKFHEKTPREREKKRHEKTPREKKRANMEAGEGRKA